MSCSTSSTPVPLSATTRASSSAKRSVSCTSSPEDGSSSSRKSNGPARQRASSTMRRWPVDRAPACTPARSPRPHSSIASAAAARLARHAEGLAASCRTGFEPASAASWPRRTFSSTPSVSQSSTDWNVRPRPRRARAAGGSRVTSSSWNSTVPSKRRLRPLQALNVQVLPAPLGPIRPLICPSGARKLRSRTATSPPKRIVRSRTSSPEATADTAASAPGTTRGWAGTAAGGLARVGDRRGRRARSSSACSRRGIVGLPPAMATMTADTPNTTLSHWVVWSPPM